MTNKIDNNSLPEGVLHGHGQQLLRLRGEGGDVAVALEEVQQLARVRQPERLRRRVAAPLLKV